MAHRAALTLEEQWETLSDMAQCTSRLTAQDAARVQVNEENILSRHVFSVFFGCCFL